MDVPNRSAEQEPELTTTTRHTPPSHAPAAAPAGEAGPADRRPADPGAAAFRAAGPGAGRAPDRTGRAPAPGPAADPPAVRPPAVHRLLGRVLVGCGLALLPWLFVLAADLPATATAAHWPLAWVGLDAMEALGLIATGLLAVRRDHRLALPATATAVLLVVDAWFDATTSASGTGLAAALLMAACVELPLAAVCALLAIRALPRGRR